MKTTTQTNNTFEPVRDDALVNDFKSATFIVSLAINLTLFVTWVTLQLHV